MALPTHRLYQSNVYDWRFYRLLYEASSTYLEEHLERYPVELDSDIKRRRERAIIPNHVRAIMETYSSHLLAQPVQRSDSDFGDNFFRNVDLMGTTADEFAKRVSELAQREGRCAILVDRYEPEGERISRADDERLGVRPYWQAIPAERLINWKVDRWGNLLWCVIQEGFSDSEDRTWSDADEDEVEDFRVWTKEEWILYRSEGESEPVEVDRGAHPCGRVPVEFVFYGIRSGPDPIARSMIADVAPMNRRLVNLYSMIDEQISHHVFSMLVVDNITFDSLRGANWSVQGALGVPHDASFQPYYLTPGSESITSIADQIRNTEQSIRYLSGLGRQNDDSLQPSSGKAMAYQTMDKVARLKSYAQKHEDLEARLVSLSAAWMERQAPEDWTAQYTREFQESDLKSSLEAAIALESLGVKGTAAIENKIAAARVVLGDRVSSEQMQRIEDELRGIVDPATGQALPEGQLYSIGSRAGGDATKNALNGAQVEALVQIVADVAAGRIPRESGVATVARAFNTTSAEAEALIGPAGSSFTIDPETVTN